jgi:hypothetical protein
MLAGHAQHVNEKGAGKQDFNAENCRESRTVYSAGLCVCWPCLHTLVQTAAALNPT